MAQKLIIVAGPGIDSAFAISLAVNDPDLEVLALAATAGEVPSDLATRNAQIVIEQIDPVRWPRIGAALAVDYDRNATNLHGADGLGGLNLPCAQLHHQHPSDRLIAELVRQHPNEVTIAVLGPATVLARTFDRDQEISRLVSRVLLVGGSWHDPGDVGPVSEFRFWCDPQSARQVIRSGAPVTLLPLDVTRKFILAPNDIRTLQGAETRTGQFLRRLMPTALAPTANVLGVEGVHVGDALAMVALHAPDAFSIRSVYADVETHGHLTRGMSVFDTRWGISQRPNIDVVVNIELASARAYVQRVLADHAV